MSISDDKIWQTGVPSDEISSNIMSQRYRDVFIYGKNAI